MRMTVASPAKLNLFLDITGKRNDGYHLINTVMQTVSLYDDVTVSVDEVGSGISVSCTDENIPCTNENTAYIAAEKFFEYTGIQKMEVGIKIKKRIPYGAGMAGGSTDAAAVIFALNEMLQAGLSVDEMAEIGEKVGADVPFCIYGGTMNATGIGTILSPLPDMPDCTIVAIKPDFEISTKEAYLKSDMIGYDNIKSPDAVVDAICNGNVRAMARNMYNKFEEISGIAEVEEIKNVMKDCGAYGAIMTGSGSTVFGIFDDDDKAEDSRQELRDRYGNIYILKPVPHGPKQINPGIFTSIFE